MLGDVGRNGRRAPPRGAPRRPPATTSASEVMQDKQTVPICTAQELGLGPLC